MSLSGRRLTLTLAGVLAVVLVLGAGAAFAVGRAQRLAGAPGSGPDSSGGGVVASSMTTDGRPSSGTTATGSPGASPAPSGTPGPSATPSAGGGSAPPPSSGDGGSVQVPLSPSAEGSPHAAEISGLIRRYFTAINRHDYDAWLATVSTAQAKQTYEKWIAGYKTTRDSDIYVSDINEGDPITVRMQFVSHQSVELAPSGLKAPCVRWDVTYKIVDEGTGLRVGTSAKSPSMAACS
jgi:hypothetical protein